MKVFLVVVLSLAVAACFSPGTLAIYGGRATTAEESPFAAVICSLNGDRVDRAMPSGTNGTAAADADSLLNAAFGIAGDNDECHAVCSGSLVSPGVVLSAGHCFSSLAEFFVDMSAEARESFLQNLTSTITVQFGEGDGSSSSTTHKVSDGYGVQRIVIEEGFDLDQGTAESNLALLFLDSCVDNRTPIKMLKNDNNDDQTASALDSMSEGMPLSVVGFGDDHPACVSQEDFTADSSASEEEEGEKGRMQAMDYQLTKVNQVNQQATEEMLQLCEQSPNPLCGSVGVSDLGPTCNGTLTLCLKAESSGSTCTGDGGAPIFALDETEAVTQPVQIGVLGTGMVEVEGGSLASGDLVYTDYAYASLLTAHTQWLESHIANDTCIGTEPVSDLFVSIDELAM
jgi:hypothetical protein